MKKLLIFAIAALGMLACTGKNGPRNSATISCDPNTLIVGQTGDKFTVNVSSKSEWKATTDKSWVTVTPNSGLGNAFVTIKVADGDDTEAHVLFSNGESYAKLTVCREIIRCEPNSITAAESGSFIVSVESNAEWSASADKPWVTVTPTSCQNSAEVTIKVTAGDRDNAIVTFRTGVSSTTLLINREWPGGTLSGIFSVSNTQKVYFSQGNLQYHIITNTWRFAEQQNIYMGSMNRDIHNSSNLTWIDLFCWGTGNNPTYIGTNYSFVDWGVNAISNGGNEANLWRTLTQEEWEYLFISRINAKKLFGLGTVEGVKGTILLPDNWETPQGASFTPSTKLGLNYKDGYYSNSNSNNFSHNIYTAEEWSVMETAGAVFLPAAGDRSGSNVYSLNEYGYYWSATSYGYYYNEYYAYVLGFNKSSLNPTYSYDSDCGLSVRLVKDVE